MYSVRVGIEKVIEEKTYNKEYFQTVKGFLETPKSFESSLYTTLLDGKDHTSQKLFHYP